MDRGIICFKILYSTTTIFSSSLIFKVFHFSPTTRSIHVAVARSRTHLVHPSISLDCNLDPRCHQRRSQLITDSDFKGYNKVEFSNAAWSRQSCSCLKSRNTSQFQEMQNSKLYSTNSSNVPAHVNGHHEQRSSGVLKSMSYQDVSSTQGAKDRLSLIGSTKSDHRNFRKNEEESASCSHQLRSSDSASWRNKGFNRADADINNRSYSTKADESDQREWEYTLLGKLILCPEGRRFKLNFKIFR